MNYYPYSPYGMGQTNTYLPRQELSPAPQMPQAVPQLQGYPCRPVTSREEVVAAQIPFDGSTSYFVDTANGKIYAKTFNFQDGTAPVVTYVREQVPPAVQYATVDDLKALREELMAKPKKVAKKDDPDE